MPNHQSAGQSPLQIHNLLHHDAVLHISRHGFFLGNERTVIVICVLVIALTSNMSHFNVTKNGDKMASNVVGSLLLFEYVRVEPALVARGGVSAEFRRRAQMIDASYVMHSPFRPAFLSCMRSSFSFAVT